MKGSISHFCDFCKSVKLNRPDSGQATTHFAVRKFSGDDDPQFRPKIDAMAPLAHVSADLPPILCICGQPPFEWKARAEENRFLVASCEALGHPAARYIELPSCDPRPPPPSRCPISNGLFWRDGFPESTTTPHMARQPGARCRRRISWYRPRQCGLSSRNVVPRRSPAIPCR